MLGLTTEQRVTNLEDLMAQVLRSMDDVNRQLERTDRQVERTQSNLDRLSLEMREFKDEMRDFKDEMRGFKDEMSEFKDEMSDFKDEMRVFKDEMGDFKDEMRVFKDEMGDFKDEMRDFKDEMGEFKDKTDLAIIQMRKQWGELSNKMGTMAEDLVAPSVSRILRQTVGCPDDRLDSVAVRVRRRRPIDPSYMQEFDVVAACGEYVLINETKSSLAPEDVKEFVEVLLTARDYFPEYIDKKIIGAIASLYVDESLVRHGEKQGLIVLGFGEDVMDVLNSPDFVPRMF